MWQNLSFVFVPLFVALGRRCGRAPISIQWVLSALAILPLLFVGAYYTHALDGVWYYEWRASPLIDVAPALAGISAGVWLSRLKRPGWLQITTAITLTVCALAVVHARPLLRPLDLSNLPERWENSVCLQSTAATCGPCAVASVLRARGRDVTESELARTMQTDAGGTLNWLMLRELRRLGERVQLRERSSLDDVRWPAVIGVKLNGFGHYVALLNVREDRFIVGDPLVGRLSLTRQEFEQKYAVDQFALEWCEK